MGVERQTWGAREARAARRAPAGQQAAPAVESRERVMVGTGPVALPLPAAAAAVVAAEPIRR